MKNTHELILKDKGNGQLLLKNKHNWIRASEVRFKIPASSKNAQDEFFGFYDRIGTDSLPKGAIQFDVNFKLSTDQQPFKAQLVFSAQDSLGNQLFYDFLPMHWLRSEWKTDRISLTRRFATLPPKTHRLIVYLWNIEKAKFEITEVEVLVTNLK